jgi:hypothetical protein
MVIPIELAAAPNGFVSDSRRQEPMLVELRVVFLSCDRDVADVN